MIISGLAKISPFYVVSGEKSIFLHTLSFIFNVSIEGDPCTWNSTNIFPGKKLEVG